jgi:hypothetical protein
MSTPDLPRPDATASTDDDLVATDALLEHFIGGP